MSGVSPSRLSMLSRLLNTFKEQVWLVPSLILAFGLFLTLIAGEMAQQQARLRRQNLFDAQLVRLVSRIEEHIRANEQMLRGVAGLFESSEDVSRDEFRRYFEALELNANYPGIQGIGFSRPVLPAELEAHVRAFREEGLPAYRVHPPGARDLYTAIVLLEPLDWRNRKAIGFDMFSEPVRREAMLRARHTGQAALSGKVRLVQETEEEDEVQAGFLLYVPVHQYCDAHANEFQCGNQFAGWAYSPIRMKDFMEGIIQKEFQNALGIGVEIHDPKNRSYLNPSA